MSHVSAEFINPLLVHFDLRKNDQQKFLADLAQRLSRYDAKTLRAAAEELITSHDKTTFPSVTVCLRAIARHHNSGNPDPTRKVRERADSHDPTSWNPLLECQLGVQAGEEGWIICLLDFANRKGRLPMGEREVGWLKAEANRIRNRTLSDPTNWAAPSLARTWDRRTAALTDKARAAA